MNYGKTFIIALTLLAMAGAIYASRQAFNFVSTKENVAVIFFSTDTWNLIPFIDTVWSKDFSKKELSPELKERLGPELHATLRESDTTAAYVFDAKERRYILLVKHGKKTDEARAIDLDDVSRYPALWVYPKKGAGDHLYLKLDPSKMPKVSDFTMKKGWNFFWLTPDINMVPLEQYKGNCTIQKAAVWEGKWTVHDYAGEITRLKDETPGAVFLLKVASDCQLRHEETVPKVPPLPNSEVQINENQALPHGIRVVSEQQVGGGERDQDLLGENPYIFKLSPLDKIPKEFTVRGNKIVFKAIEAHEDTDTDFVPYTKSVCSRDKQWCQTKRDWMIISINEKNIEFGREEIKKIKFDNGLEIYFVAADIEGSSSGFYGSDVGFSIINN